MDYIAQSVQTAIKYVSIYILVLVLVIVVSVDREAQMVPKAVGSNLDIDASK